MATNNLDFGKQNPFFSMGPVLEKTGDSWYDIKLFICRVLRRLD